MSLRCAACKQSTEGNQPFYCTQCFIPVPPYDQNKYIGHEIGHCPHCSALLKGRIKCNECDVLVTLPQPPVPGEMSHEMKVRDTNRKKLTQEVLKDNRMTGQLIEMLGLSHLSQTQQGVALSALAREKMHFLSTDYNFTEAQTLTDMGFALVEEAEEEWAKQNTATRLATLYIRRGMALEASLILTDLFKNVQNEKLIDQFRKLEILSYLALAHRLAGTTSLAEEAAEQAHEALLTLYQEMEVEIEEIIQNKSLKSEFMGLDENNVSFPRIDYVFTILVILVEEVIARGAIDPLLFSDLVIDRMLELNNILKILGNLTPDDDYGYFASHLRDYVRLASGLLWYGEVLLHNSDARRRHFIEEYYDRIKQWSGLIQSQYWLPLRPARFFEIFMRAQKWSNKIDAEALMNSIFQQSPPEYKASWHYIMGDTHAKLGQFDKAISHLEVITQETENYVKYADDELKNLSNQLLHTIQLESIGIILRSSIPQDDWLSFPINIQLQEIQSSMERATYLKPEFKPPILRLSFDLHSKEPSIDIFGDRLFDLYESMSTITKVGNRAFDDPAWLSPLGTLEKQLKGERNDVVVIRTQIEDHSISLLFKGLPQKIQEYPDKIVLDPSPLLTLRGVIYHEDIDIDRILSVIISIMSENPSEVVEIYTLKKINST